MNEGRDISEDVILVLDVAKGVTLDTVVAKVETRWRTCRYAPPVGPGLPDRRSIVVTSIASLIQEGLVWIDPRGSLYLLTLAGRRKQQQLLSD